MFRIRTQTGPGSGFSFDLSSVSFIKFPILTSSFRFFHQVSVSFIKFPNLSSSFRFFHQVSDSFIKFPILSSFCFFHQVSDSFIKFPILSSSFRFFHQVSDSFIKFPILSLSFDKKKKNGSSFCPLISPAYGYLLMSNLICENQLLSVIFYERNKGVAFTVYQWLNPGHNFVVNKRILIKLKIVQIHWTLDMSSSVLFCPLWSKFLTSSFVCSVRYFDRVSYITAPSPRHPSNR